MAYRRSLGWPPTASRTTPVGDPASLPHLAAALPHAGAGPVQLLPHRGRRGQAHLQERGRPAARCRPPLGGPPGWDGSKGRRWYAWAWLATASPRHYLLIRRPGHLRRHRRPGPPPHRHPGTRPSLARPAPIRRPGDDPADRPGDRGRLLAHPPRLAPLVAGWPGGAVTRCRPGITSAPGSPETLKSPWPAHGGCPWQPPDHAERAGGLVVRVAGSPNRGRVPGSKRVMAEMRVPERVKTISPTV